MNANWLKGIVEHGQGPRSRSSYQEMQCFQPCKIGTSWKAFPKFSIWKKKKKMEKIIEVLRS